MRSRGVSLVSVLLVSTLAVLLAFTIAGATLGHLGMASRVTNAEVARRSAEAITDLVLARLCKNPLWGTAADKSGLPGFVELPIGNDGAMGRVSFVAGQFSGLPASINNLSSATTAAGWNRTVPPISVQILAQGSFRNQVKTLETIVAIPPYKYAISTTGQFFSNGSLSVLAVDDISDLANGPDKVPASKLRGGNLASNSNLVQPQDPAINLLAAANSLTNITGDVQTPGSINMDPDFVKIHGATKAHSDPVKIPTMTVTNYDPALTGSGFQTVAQGVFNASQNVTSALRRTGDLKIFGDLILDEGYLYVEGNLEVTGSMTGKGMVVSTKNVTVGGASALNVSGAVGLIAKGDVQLTGSASGPGQMNANTFRGVVYTEGDFTATSIQLVGAFIGNKTGGSNITLSDVSVVANPQTLNITWDNGFQPPIQINPSDLQNLNDWFDKMIAATNANPALLSGTLRLDPGDKPAGFFFNHLWAPIGALKVASQQIPGATNPQFMPPLYGGAQGNTTAVQQSQLDKAMNLRVAAVTAGIRDYNTNPYLNMVGIRTQSGKTFQTLDEWYFDAVYLPYNNAYQGVKLSGGGYDDLGNPPGDHPQGIGRTLNRMVNNATYVSPLPSVFDPANPDPGVPYMINDLNAAVNDYNLRYQAFLKAEQSVLQGAVSLNPNQFIQLSDKLRKILVREVQP